jgi:hypothetical protein
VAALAAAGLGSSGARVVSRTRTRARLAVAALALIIPGALCAQGLEHGASLPPSGPLDRVARAGVDAEGDGTAHHGTHARHVAVGALIGGAAGWIFGVAADRPWLGVGESKHGHFTNLWLVTIPVGAAAGALAGALWPSD